MALFDIKLFSTALLTQTDIRVVVPTPDEPFKPDETPYYKEGKKYQVLYLLHGGFGDCTVWTRNTGIERFAQKHKLIVVCASVTNSMYMDMAHGNNFFTFYTQELPQFINYMFPVSTKREDTFIAGMSMGGYGAMRIGFEFPERYASVVSLSGGLEMTKMDMSVLKHVKKSPMNIQDIFGEDPENLEKNDLYNVVGARIKEGKTLPRVYISCGTEDFLYETNVRAKDKYIEMGLDVTYFEAPGEHNWDFWDPEIRKVLNEWLPLAHTLVD
ncbi:MAG: esterase family protein [Oscillospiraceae bacterium]|nr:esterase family protein [Oscillospiraceae bacterium]